MIVQAVTPCHRLSSRMYALRGEGGGEKSTLFTLVIMMNIMDGPVADPGSLGGGGLTIGQHPQPSSDYEEE